MSWLKRWRVRDRQNNVQMFFLFLTAVIIKYTHGSHRNTEKFVCENFACGQASLSNQTLQYYESIELCRLVCGRYGNLWPIPTETLTLGRMAIQIDPTTVEILIDDDASSGTKAYLNDISKLFLVRLWQGCDLSRAPSTKVQVRLRAKKDDLTLDMDTRESYKLAITTDGQLIEAFIEGDTVYGVRHGLETLLQLTARKESSSGKCAVLMLTRAVVRDTPLYKHRGILMDTSRNFIPMEDLKRTIDGMGSVKLNVLHWHAVDSHSFPLKLNNVPKMAETGAYSSKETYSVEEQEELIEYAKRRGVRILLEIDSPAHAGNGWTWGPAAGMGEMVLCANKEPWRQYCFQAPCGQLNPINPNVYKVLGEMFKEINERFTTHDLFHLGGDEVKLDCWNSTKSIRDYLLSKGMGLSTEAFHEFWADFHQKSLEAWDSAVGHSKTNIVLWTSDLTDPQFVLDRLDPKRFIIQSWTGSDSDIPNRLIQKGYRVIFSTVDTWYLDHGFWGETRYHPWRTVYNYMIPAQSDRVLGGEVCMWSEYVDKQSLDMKIWPRSAALAERLWSDPKTIGYGVSGDVNQVEYRLASARDRLTRLGIQPDQIMPRWCYLNQDKCK